MAYPVFAAGQRLTASMLQGLQWQEVEQGSDQTVNNSSILVDTNLTVTLPAGSRWLYRLLVGYDGGATPDMQVAWTAPTNGEVQRWTWGLGRSGTGNENSFTAYAARRPLTTTAVIIGGSGVGQVHSYNEEGVFVAGDGGIFTLQYAQSVADASALRLLASSRLTYLRIE